MGKLKAPKAEAEPSGTGGFTYRDYRKLPSTGPCYQLIGGQLVMTPSPTYRHQTILARLFFRLYGFVEPRALGIVRYAPLDVVLCDQSVVQPDLLFVSRSRKGILRPEGIFGAPDLCVEALSPGTQAIDRGAKLLLYARHGVLEYWLVDPDRNRIEVHDLKQDSLAPGRTLGKGESLTTVLLPGFSLDLAELFAD